MKTLIVSDSKCDFVDVLESCGAETECIEFQKVLTVNLEDYDSFCILPEESGAYLEAALPEPFPVLPYQSAYPWLHPWCSSLLKAIEYSSTTWLGDFTRFHFNVTK